MNHWIPPFTKWRVHLTLLAFLPSFTKFLRAFEFLNQRMLPSLLTNIMPVPGSISSPLNVQILRSGIYFHLALIFLASRPVSFNIKMSPILTGPKTFLVIILPTSRGFGASFTRTFTCVPLRSFRFCLQLQQPQQPSTEDTLLLFFTHIFSTPS